MIVTFFGHSDFRANEFYKTKLLKILKTVTKNEPVLFYLGGYGQFDNFAYECAKEIKQKQDTAKLIFVTPYLTIDYQKNHLEAQKSKFDSILYPPLERVPLKFAISHRNRFMVDHADFVIVYITHSFGGAYQSYQYAKRKRKTIFNLAEAYKE